MLKPRQILQYFDTFFVFTIRVSIDPRTGVVTLIDDVPQGLDSLEIELVATDGGGRSSTSTLKITLKDEFPEAPQFDSHIYNATVIENRDVFQESVTVHVSCLLLTEYLLILQIILAKTQRFIFLFLTHSSYYCSVRII